MKLASATTITFATSIWQLLMTFDDVQLTVDDGQMTIDNGR